MWVYLKPALALITRIMHSFNSVILYRSFTGSFWCFIGDRVIDGPSVRTLLQSQWASNREEYSYVDGRADGSPAVERMCIGREQMDWLLSQCLCVCDEGTGNTSLTFPQASVVLRSCHGNWWTTDEALLYENQLLCVNTQYVLPVATVESDGCF